MADITELEQLLKNSFRDFEYVELIAIIKEYNDRFVNKSNFSVKTIPNSSYTFPSSDISNIRYSETEVELEARFLSLLGVSSPLQYDLISSIDKDGEGEALKYLLTILNRRVYKLFEKAIDRNRLTAPFGKDSNIKSETEGFFNLTNATSNYGSLAFKGRGAEGLSVLLKKWFSLSDVVIEEFTGKWVEVDYKTNLNGETELGKCALLGERIFSPESAFKIIIKEIERERFENRKFREKIRDAVSEYISDPLDFEIEFRLKREDSVKLSLSESCGVGLGFGVSLGTISAESVELAHIQS